jgi:hypothetical protein
MVDEDPSEWERLAADIEATVNKAFQELELWNFPTNMERLTT